MEIILFATTRAFNCHNALAMQSLNFSPFPVLQTNRLLLRQLQPADAPAIFALRTDDATNRLIGRKKATAIEEAYTFIENRNEDIVANKSMYWAVCLKNEPGLAGTFCLFNFNAEYAAAEVGYEFLPHFRGRGFAKEALESVLQYCFETLKLKRIDAYVNKENEPSLRLLKKLGFVVNPERKDEHNANNLILQIERGLPAQTL